LTIIRRFKKNAGNGQKIYQKAVIMKKNQLILKMKKNTERLQLLMLAEQPGEVPFIEFLII